MTSEETIRNEVEAIQSASASLTAAKQKFFSTYGPLIREYLTLTEQSVPFDFSRVELRDVEFIPYDQRVWVNLDYSRDYETHSYYIPLSFLGNADEESLRLIEAKNLREEKRRRIQESSERSELSRLVAKYGIPHEGEE